MSNIDPRVVEMRFENRQFERGVRESTQSLSSLKSSLNMTGAISSLSKIGSTLDGLTSKFSTMGVVGMTTISNLTTSMNNMALSFAKSLTTDPVTQGFDEYELKMNAIQTLLTNTASKGTSLKDINKALSELNEYSDKTIYNFGQMTDNVSKFSAAGLGLEDSVVVVKGLSNVAAGFGVDAQKMAAATYQMTQALSAGAVKLMDWNSLQQAGMGGESLQLSMKETAQEMGIFVDKSKPFRETLESGWLSTEVFVKTMEKMAKDKSLLDAAQNVTTFTKLLSTMKESVASGWAQTWELIVGDKNRSTQFFTSLSNAFAEFSGGLSDARNASIKFWDEMGGRRDTLIGFANLFTTLANAVRPIEGIFDKILPVNMGNTLVNISSSFRYFTELLLTGGNTATQLGRIIGGIHATFQILGDILNYTVDKVILFTTTISPVTNILMGMMARVGDFMMALRNILTSFGGFNADSIVAIGQLIANTFTKNLGSAIIYISQAFGIFGKVLHISGEQIKVLTSYIEPLLGFLVKIKDKISAFALALSTVTTPFAETNQQIERVTKSAENMIGVGLIFSSIIKVLKTSFEIVGKLLEGILVTVTRFVTLIKDTFLNSLEGLNIDKILDIIETLLKLNLISTLTDMLKSFKTTVIDVGTTLKSISGAFDIAGSAIQQWQNNIKAGIIKDIAIAVGLLAISIYMISEIKSDRLGASTAAISTLFVEVAAAMKILSGMALPSSMLSMQSMGLAIISLSVAVSILSSAMLKLEKLSWGNTLKGILAITGMILSLSKVIGPLAASSKGLFTVSIAMAALGVGLNILSFAVIRLGNSNLGSLIKGVASMSVVLLSLAGFAQLMRGATSGLIASSVGLTILSGALIVFSNVVVGLGFIRWDVLEKGLKSLGIMLGLLVVTSKGLSLASKGILKSSVAMVIVAKAIKSLTESVKILGELRFDNIQNGLLSLGATLLGISLFNATTNSISLLVTATGLVIFSKALSTLSSSLIALANIDTNKLQNGIFLLGGLLLSLNIAIYALPKATDVIRASASVSLFAGSLSLLYLSVSKFAGITLAGALNSFVTLGSILTLLILTSKKLGSATTSSLSIIAMAGALQLLLIPIITLSKIPLETTIIGIAALAASILALGAVMYVLTPIAPVITTISVAVALLGAALLATGAGILLLSAGLGAIASVAIPLFEIIKKGGGIFTGLVEMINDFLKSLKSTIDIVLDLIISAVPKILKIVAMLLEGIIKIIEENVKPIVDLAVKIIVDFANALRRNEQEVIKAIDYLEDKVFERLDAWISKIVKFAWNLIWKFSQALTDAIRSSGEDIGLAIRNAYLGIDTPEESNKRGFDIGNNYGLGLSEGLDNSQKEASKSASSLSNQILDDINLGFGGSTYKSGNENGSNLISGFSFGMNDKKPELITTVKNIFGDVVKTVDSSLNQSGGKGALSSFLEKMGDTFRKTADIQDTSSTENTKKIINNTENNAKKTGNSITKSAASIKSAYDKSMEWIDDRKYYEQLSLKEELAAYISLATKYQTGSEERKKLDREIFRVKKEIIQEQIELEKKAYDYSLTWINDKKYYSELSLQEELAAYERVQARYQNGTEERKSMDKEVYRVKKELSELEEKNRQKAFEHSNDWLAMEEEMRRSNMRLQLEGQQRILKAEEKYMQQKNLNEDTDRAKTTRRKIAKLNAEIADEEIKLNKDITELKTKSLKELTKLEEEKAKKTKEINKKEQDSIKELKQEYADAVKSRTEAIFSSYGLFDVLDEERNKTKELLKLKEELSSAESRLNTIKNDKTIYDPTIEKRMLLKTIGLKQKELETIQAVQKNNRQGSTERDRADIEAKTKKIELDNMVAQLEVLEDTDKKYKEMTKTRTDLELEIKNINQNMKDKGDIQGEDLIRNLQDQVGELTTWRDNIAELTRKGISGELLSELRDMGPKALGELKALNKLSSGELTKYADLWSEKYRLSNTQAKLELEGMVKTNAEKMNKLRSNTVKELDEMNNDINKEMLDLGTSTESSLLELEKTWVKGLGNIATTARNSFTTIFSDIKKDFKDTFYENGVMTEEIKKEIYTNIKKAIDTPVKVLTDSAIGVTKTINSGLQTIGASIIAPVVEFSEGAITGIKGVISDITNFFNTNIDTQPKIKPVLDLSNIKNGAKTIQGMYGQTSYNLVDEVYRTNNSGTILNGQNGSKTISNNFNISSMVIREEADISKVSKELFKLQKSKDRG
jgi:tape measure domain-containing protein